MKGILTLKKLAVIAAVCIAVLCILGCSSESESELGNYAPIAVDSVWIYTSALTLKPGESYTLSASVMPDNADDKTVRWSSSNTLIATVGDYGMVTAYNEGTATIIAYAGGKSASCLVTVEVERQTVEVQSVTLDAETLLKKVGETRKLVATVTPDNADDKTVRWSSSNTSIATVSDDGTVTMVGVGEVIISAKAGGKEARCAIIVGAQNNNTPDSGTQGGSTHVHNYSGGICTVCGLQKPIMVDATIDDSGVLTKYRGGEAIVVIPDGVTGIGSYAFEYCESLTDVSIPSSVTAIGSYAFQKCKKLYYLSMSEGLTNIGTYAFSDCIELTSVMIPASVKNIGSSAFSGCTNLERVSMVKGLESIDNQAFSSCKNLYSVYIPSSVKIIGNDAFWSCDKLNSVSYDGTESDWKHINARCGLMGKTIIGKDENGNTTKWISE